ncbi:Fe-Mn family superoxide dismutase [Paraburkholderia rhynchosiae]|uniref:superoxide dismutase n=1 Tax=Paraburkholderia rhynchosiae TaxID=487049 RepID=A0A6J5CRE8_9BURK|nr:hypothetical protein LMG27174_06815 [Paraburkholderia rhynchosiae]
MDMRARKPVSHPMAEIAAFVAQMKSAFGEQEIDEAIRRGKAGEATPYACENGRLVGTAAPVRTNVWHVGGAATGKLMILQCENHQKLTAWGIQPILVLDVFEHAYYLKYQNRRNDYVNQLFSIVNWDNAASRLQTATRA